MLDLLPNKILHNIFSKTEPETAKTCRLLNRRFDTFITENGYNKEHLADFRILPTTFNDFGRVRSVSINIQFNRKKKITFNNHEEMLEGLPQYLEKIGRIDKMMLLLIPINQKLLEILNQQKFLSHIRKFEVQNCTIEAEDEQIWFSLLEKLNVEELKFTASMEASSLALPPTILNHVRKMLYVSSHISNVLLEMPWLVDSVFLNWFTPDKTLYLERIVTGMTVQGIIECTKMLPKDDKLSHIKKFGILNNTTKELVELTMREARIPHKYTFEVPFFNDPAKFYQIVGRKKSGQERRRLVAEFGCVDPEKVYEHPQVDLYGLASGLVDH